MWYHAHMHTYHDKRDHMCMISGYHPEDSDNEGYTGIFYEKLQKYVHKYNKTDWR